MTRFLLILYAVLILCSCGQNSSETLLVNRADSLIALQKRFKYHNLSSFQTDTLSWDSRTVSYQEVDSSTFANFFKQGNKEFTIPAYDRAFYYSWQNRDSNFIEFVILTQEEGSYCDLLKYYVFNKTGVFLSSFDIALNCSDAGWTFQGSSKQISKQEILYNTIESQESGIGGTDSEKLEGDSIGYKIVIWPSGEIEKVETYKKHFLN